MTPNLQHGDPKRNCKTRAELEPEEAPNVTADQPLKSSIQPGSVTGGPLVQL